MTASREPDRMIHAFLLEGEEQLPDQAYDAVRAEIEQKRQRAVIGPWRFPTMNRFMAVGLGAAAVALAVVVGTQLLGTSTGGFGGPGADPTPTPTTEPSVAEPSAAPSEAAATSAAGDFLPEGPVVVWDSPHEDEPSITMTVSAPGWIYGTAGSDEADEPVEYLEKGEEVDNVPEALVLSGSLPPGTGFYVYGDPCQWGSTRPDTPATTVDDIVAALAAQASRDASDPVDVTLGGYAGKMITLHVPVDADFANCDDGEFASYTIVGEERWQWHQGPGQIDDFWFVDVEGSIVEIRASYRPDTSDDLLEEMRTLVESTTFQFP